MRDRLMMPARETSSPDDEVAFRPSWQRAAACAAGVGAVGLVAELLVHPVRTGGLTFSVLSAGVALLVFSAFEILGPWRNSAIVVSTEAVSGPSMSGSHRVTISFIDIDRGRMERRRRWKRFDAGAIIQSTAGDRIALSPVLFDQRTIRAIWQAIEDRSALHALRCSET